MQPEEVLFLSAERASDPGVSSKIPFNLSKTQTATRMDLSLDRSISDSVQRGLDIDILSGSHYELVSAIKMVSGY